VSAEETPAEEPVVEEPPVAVTFSTSSNIQSTQTKEQETQRRLEAMMQFTLSFNQYLQSQATEKRVEENAQPAPAPAPAEPSPEVQQAGIDLLGYMLAIMNAMILCMQNQSKVAQQTTDMSEASVQLAKEQLDESLANYDKLMHEQRDRGFFGKIASAFKALGDILLFFCLPAMFIKMGVDAATGKNDLREDFAKGDIFKAIGDEYKAVFFKFCEDNLASGGMFTVLIALAMLAAAPFTGGTSMALMAAFMLIMEVSGGQKALNEAIEKVGPLWAQILLEVAVVVVEAVVLAGAAGIAETAVSKISTTGAETGAKVAATAGTAGVNASVAGANATANSVQATLENILNSLKDAMKRVFGETGEIAVRNIGGKALMLSSTTSLWSDLVRGILEISNKCGADISEETEDRISAIAGMVLGLLAAIGGGLLELGAGSSNLPKLLESKLGETTFDTLKTTIGALTSVFVLQQATYSILYGLQLRRVGEIMEELATSQGIQALLSNILDRLQMTAASNTRSMNALNDTYNAIGKRMNMFVTEWSAFV
jgi:hypothetical protein